MSKLHRNDLAKVESALADLNLTDRCTVLAASIAQSNPAGIGPALGFIACAAQLAEQMSTEQRFRVALFARDSADRIERSRELQEQ